ncbi:MAG: tRNA-dihydrouridine synthase family protein [Synergistaceae bacterium]|jgi:tRNA-dihydrouridine synthase|nr:tRNA-dihydrouridine synthase family protein [Synergistaceae bacterium]
MSETEPGPGSVTVGGLILANPLWLAPLAGVTTAPAREFFSRLGAGLTHTEMVSCAGLLQGNLKTQNMLNFLPKDKESGDFSDLLESPVVLQLFSGDADRMTRGAQAAVARLGPHRFAALGINMACPMPKVTRQGAGAALMKTPKTAFEMTRSLKRLGLPVWVKTRRLSEIPETLRFVDGLVEAGADNVCVHGRTPPQRYEGQADRQVVTWAAARFPGKISASGDVYAVEDIEEYLGMGCVGVMLARGALADPYLFPQALSALGYPIPLALKNPTREQRLEQLKRLGERARQFCGTRGAVVLIKRLMAGALKGTRGSRELRRRAGSTTDLNELLEVLKT